MLKQLLKKLIGDKAEGDMKDIRPVVSAVHAAETEIRTLSDDALRGKTATLKTRIAEHTLAQTQEAEALREKAAAMGEVDLEAKEAVYEALDALDKEINVSIEEVLEEIMPEAFAVVKETARRLSENHQLNVEATDWDRDIAARRGGVQIEGDRAIWSNKWMAAGSEVEWNMIHYDVQLVGGAALHRGKVKRWWQRFRCSSTLFPEKAFTWSQSTITWRAVTRNGWLRFLSSTACALIASISTSPIVNREGKRIARTSHTAPTMSSVLTISAITWRSDQSNWFSASTITGSSMKWILS
jgi:hypothetical protein